MRARMLAVVIICLFAAMSVVEFVNAAGNATSYTVWTTGSGSSSTPIQTTFLLNDYIYIYWTSLPPGSTVDIFVYPPGHNEYTTPLSFLGVTTGSAPVNFQGNLIGTWEIKIVGAGEEVECEVEVEFEFIVPEYVLGSVVPIVACFAAVAIFRFKRRSNSLN